MKLHQSVLLVLSFFMTNAIATTSRWSGDWFEVEVILVQQLGDKSTLNEVFPKARPPHSSRPSLDLLSNYLNPDITDLKPLLPLCSANE